MFSFHDSCFAPASQENRHAKWLPQRDVLQGYNEAAYHARISPESRAPSFTRAANEQDHAPANSEILKVSLFDEDPQIPGLILVENFLTDPAQLLEAVDQLPWMDDLSRRVQHFGWRYDYRARTVSPSAHLGPLPAFMEEVAQRLHREGLTQQVADQAIVNEYLPGQGIAAHIDCEPCFGPEIAMISLGDDYPMRFSHVSTAEVIDVWLPVGSACVISGPARYEWRHEIAKRKSDPFGGTRKLRKRRVSATFRTVILS